MINSNKRAAKHFGKELFDKLYRESLFHTQL